MSTSPGLPTDARPFPFLSLPLELRMLIYRACMDSQNGEEQTTAAPTRNTTFDVRWPTQSESAYEHARVDNFTIQYYHPLLECCRTVRSEAALVFDNHDQPFPSIRLLYAFLRSIGRLRRLQLQKLTFVYHLSSEHYRWQNRLAQSELASKCFRLITRECPKLHSLCVLLNWQYLKMFSLITHVEAWRSDSEAIRRALEEFELGRVLGMRDLRAIRGIAKVEFKPASEAKGFDKDIRLELDNFAREMMQPKKNRWTKETVSI